MYIGYILHQTYFVIKHRIAHNISGCIRKFWYQTQGMRVGSQTKLPPIHVTWPHKVSIGRNCNIEHGVYFKYDGIWSKGVSIDIGNNVFIGSNSEFNIKKQIRIGNDCLIGSGSRFIDHDHGVSLGYLIRNQNCPENEIVIGDDVWIGCNVVVLKGVSVGNGAVVAAGSVVNKPIPPFEIWGGIPAKKIGERK